jgi:hypothetical protein
MAVLVRGTVVAGHRIESFIGRGGMGVVYRARQIALDRVVALKVIAPELIEDADIRERFLQEARSASRIDHPNVIPVHAAGEDGGVAYIAMRFVEGDDLRSLVRREGPQSVATAAGFVVQAAAALDAIHAAGYVHRDVKPANLLVAGGGHVYLTDFGLAKQVITRSGATRSGGWVGTLDYIAPEQIRGGRIDARADVYALGGVLQFMLTARVPFERDGQEAKLWAQLHDPPPPPSSIVPELPAELDAIVARAMAKDPEERFPSAGDLGRAVRAAAAGAAPSYPERMVARGAAAPGDAPVEPGIAGELATVSAARPTVVLPRRRRRRLAAAALATAAAGGGIALVALQGDDPRGAGVVRATATPAASAAAGAALHVVTTIRNVGMRPSGIALAGEDAWVISRDSKWVTRISRRTGKERSSHPPVGRGSSSIVADGGAIWVAVTDDRRVVRIDAASGKVTRRIAVPTPPVHLAAGPSGLWVAAHRGSFDELLHYDRGGSRLLARRPMPDGVGPIALGAGALWLTATAAPKLARLDLRSGVITPWVTLHARANSLRYAGGYLWASLRELDAIARVTTARRPPSMVESEAGRNPQQVAVAHGSVFVASYTDHRLVALDPSRLSRKGESVQVGFNPFAVAADERGVWVTGLGGNTVTRLAYR